MPFTLGSADEEKEYLTISDLENPWYVPRTMMDFSPTHVSFLPGSLDTSLSVTSLCTRSEGEKCSHHRDCQKVNQHMVCVNDGYDSFAVCRCDKQFPSWDPLSRICTKWFSYFTHWLTSIVRRWGVLKNCPSRTRACRSLARRTAVEIWDYAGYFISWDRVWASWVIKSLNLAELNPKLWIHYVILDEN